MKQIKSKHPEIIIKNDYVIFYTSSKYDHHVCTQVQKLKIKIENLSPSTLSKIVLNYFSLIVATILINIYFHHKPYVLILSNFILRDHSTRTRQNILYFFLSTFISSIRRYILIVATRMAFSMHGPFYATCERDRTCVYARGNANTLTHPYGDRIKGNTYVNREPPSLVRSLSALRHRNISDDAGGSWLPVSPRQKGKICKRTSITLE